MYAVRVLRSLGELEVRKEKSCMAAAIEGGGCVAARPEQECPWLWSVGHLGAGAELNHSAASCM